MSSIALEQPEQGNQPKWLVRPIVWRITPAAILLGMIILLSLGLHFYNLQAIGEANTYYTAAVKSMLTSWHNFFFVSAEPGGSVTVDKPPLGFWIEAAFAAVLGVSGFAVVLPNILAGVLSLPLLNSLVRKYFGVEAGLIAALALALTPVSVAVDRNNTIDGMLIFTMLLAAWAFISATETGRLRFLLLGALFVGLGFNIKMLEAFLPLPAFYALYFLGAKTPWGRKIVHLLLASTLLGVVSFAWAVAVDLTPADQRPFVGSTSSNSEMELIFGYNGINRLLGRMGGGAPGNFQNRAGDGGRQAPPGFNAPGGGFGFDIGQAGVLRFFQSPLAKEMSWLLPFGLLSLGLMAFSSRVHLPVISNEHKGLLLWGGWLVTCLVFFSAAGFFHNYYLATLSPALGAGIGMGFAGIAKLKERSRLLASAALLAACGLTLAFQLYLVVQFGLQNGVWLLVAAALFGTAGIISLLNFAWRRNEGVFFRLANIAILASMLVIPALWTVKTVAAANSSMLPEAYAGDRNNRSGGQFGFPGNGQDGGRGFGANPGFPGGGGVNGTLLAYLQANTQDTKYLVAVPSSQTGSSLVLETDRAVLFMGGFTGSDPVVTASSLEKLVADGDLRYILYDGMGRGGPGFNNSSSEVSAWIKSSCQEVTEFSGQNFGMRGGSTLYQCGE